MLVLASRNRDGLPSQKVAILKNPSVLLESPHLRLEFVQQGDRFTHTLSILDRGIPAVCLESVPGSPQEAWPCDPPLQQIVLEQVGTPPRTVALGVGMSGHGHWSLAAEMLPDAVSGMQWDWACRIARGAERLASSYRIHAPTSSSSLRVEEREALWTLADGRTIHLSAARGNLAWDAEHRQLTIAPTSDIQIPGTHTWCYRCWVA